MKLKNPETLKEILANPMSHVSGFVCVGAF